MGLIHWGLPWGHAILAGSGQWGWFMGMRHGGGRLDRGDGIDWWGCDMGACLIREMGLIHGGTPWGHATPAGSGRWDWFIGARHGGARPWLDRGDGFDSWGLPRLAGLGRWDWFMGLRGTGWKGAMALIYGDASWGVCDWIGEMGLICGGTPWWCATDYRSGWWDWFMWAIHGGAGWIGAMGLIHGGMPNDKVLYGCWI